MTGALTIDVDAAPVRAAFASLRRRFADLSSAWGQVGGEMLDAAVPYVPVASGALVDSLTVEAGAAGVDITSGLIYEPVQDFGWPGHNIAGHHFSDRAADAVDGAVLTELAPAMQREIDLVGLG